MLSDKDCDCAPRVLLPMKPDFDMYQTIFPSQCVISGPAAKSPVLISCGDLSFVAVDHLTLLPFLSQPPVYAAVPQAGCAIPNMKRMPMNLLMQSADTLGSFFPVFRKPSKLERHFSKDSLIDSACSGDSGVASSRCSTPSSTEAGPNTEAKKTSSLFKDGGGTPVNRRYRKTPESKRPSNGFNNNQRYPKKYPIENRNQAPNFFRSRVPRRDAWYSLTEGIWDHYLKNKQRDDMLWKKMNLRNAVHSLLGGLFPGCCLSVVGSSVNGLGTNSSDVDMCLILSTTEIDQQTEAMQLLRHAQRLLCQCSFVKSTELITAKVPILKFTDKFDIQVDLNINNTVGIANTQLIRAYSEMDWRVPPLILVVKKWAQNCNINNAKEMTLSSYSLVLMVIHYLQCGCHPPVLPCLQKLHSNGTPEYVPSWSPHGKNVFHSKNGDSLGSLLYGFFNYFANHFDFGRDVMSVRLGSKMPKVVAMNYRSSKNKRGHWKFICIEEPFNRTNTACAVYDEESFNRIMTSFRNTWLKLSEKKDLHAVLKS